MSEFDDELGELWQLFEQDATRALDEAEAALMAVQSDDSDPERLNQLYRGLHSIKGNARAMGLETTESFTHHAEDLVALCRDGAAALHGDILEAVLEAVDTLRGALSGIVARRTDIDASDGTGLAALRDKLSELVRLNDKDASRAAATDADFCFFDDLDDEVDDEAEATATPRAPEPSGAAPLEAPTASRPRPPSKEKARPSASAEPAVFVQVKASRIRELLALASDLGLAADEVMTAGEVRSAASDSDTLAEKIHRLRRLTRDLRFSSAALALVPVADLFNRLRRVARDLARQTDKAFDVRISGETTEVDRFLIDQLYDPLMHIMRNAVDHGLEDAPTRTAHGKPARGTIQLHASNAGQGIVLEIRDDGGGLDRARILDKAKRRGLLAENAEPSDADVWRLILEPGFSTRDAVSNLSGRGVGMDVVNRAVQKLRGSLSIESTAGKGTIFRIQLPVTLAFADVLVVEVANRPYAIPLEYIRRVVIPKSDDYIRSNATAEEYIRVGERSVPVVRLPQDDVGTPRTVVSVKTSRGDYAVPVAHILGTEQVTLRPLNDLLAGIRGASACGLMSNGEVAVTLDCEKLVSTTYA